MLGIRGSRWSGTPRIRGRGLEGMVRPSGWEGGLGAGPTPTTRGKKRQGPLDGPTKSNKMAPS